jgi:ankyrin repeat protein
MDDVSELFREAGAGHAASVERILRFRPELARAHNDDGLSILAFARYMKRPGILDMLIDAGPPLDIFDAASIDRSAVLRALIEHDPSLPRAWSPAGETPLHIAAYFGAVSCIELLAHAGAHLDTPSRDANARTPLHAATAGGHIDACRALLRAGADPNARDAGGLTPLMLAAAANWLELTDALIARNATLELRDAGGHTAADIAATAGHIELAARLRVGEWSIDHVRARV